MRGAGAGAGAALVSLLSLVAVKASRTATRLPVLDTDKGGKGVEMNERICKESGVRERTGQGTT